ncbi:BNR repeat-containing protein [Microbacterium sp. M28]|uniref:BNR repeat-containing protein n=1 Tax=Microbacterium sp. M28 TaxID=2962064 RepID=UPI0021F493E4|nr:BNR repeat-containing protein [Microbacterium sp. M28]UYO96552.1 BNR repeat-containing protein [Microbacterium sp. M28]
MPEPRVINDNGAWCWFQDERALVDPVRQLLVVGSVPAPEGPGGDDRAGNIELTVADLAHGTSQVVVLHERLETDDHDVPALWRRRDGRWLAVYAKHKTDDLTRWRVSESDDPTRWGPERTFDWSELTGGSGVTYSNLHELDGRLYCFVRAINDDPCALVSDDEGDTWTYAGKLFTRPKLGYVNGYTRYVSDGDRIDFVTTDHHPRDYDNSIYHGYLAAGALHDSAGALIARPAPSDDAPSQVELTTVLAAGSAGPEGVRMHAWTTDIRRAPDGTIAAVLTARVDDDLEDDPDRNHPVRDIRFYAARLSPCADAWQLVELAEAGGGLLPHEQDYTGLAAIDPYDVDSVYISTPVDPRTRDRLARHEIFHGRTSDAGITWSWTPITENSPQDNLRPIVAPGDPGRTALLWFRGEMTASQHYRCEIVLLDLPRSGGDTVNEDDSVKETA